MEHCSLLFRIGRYSCAGKQLGLMEMRYVTSQIFRHYSVRIALSEKHEDFLAGLKDGFTLSAPALRLVFEDRAHQECQEHQGTV